MVDSPLVKINYDSAEEIADLYDIGPRLAERIVRSREEQGYYSSPEDLAEVEGIGEELATTLAAHIDWEMPDEVEDQNGVDWLGMVLGLTLFILILYYLLHWLNILD